MNRHFNAILAAFTMLFALFTANPALAADTYSILSQFSKTQSANGMNPHGGLIFDNAGNLYGTTIDGGANGGDPMANPADGSNGVGGVVYELVPDGGGSWTEKVLYNFCSLANCADGENPLDSLIFDANGNLYGIADLGGANNAGVVYELKPGADGNWTESVLYSFCPVKGCADGSEPWSSLIFDKAGNIYGTTKGGGANNHGAAFELIPGANGTWTEKVLYSFCSLEDCADGERSVGSLIFDTHGNLYGTTYGGGVYTNSGCQGFESTCGTVYKLIPGKDGTWTEKVLHSFNFSNGAGSETGLILDANGNLYGTTTRGGYQANGVGVAFELSPKPSGGWTEIVLHSFPGTDGYLLSPLTFDNAGVLYGTINGHLGTAYGAVFKLVPNGNGTWKEDILHAFDHSDGSGPIGTLLLDSAGDIYGTAFSGGPGAQGVAFEITH
ncbi:MAG TPA: choice-of-anchor tandem repeat GloVer-containing protein [Terriglobales bacterium]